MHAHTHAHTGWPVAEELGQCADISSKAAVKMCRANVRGMSNFLVAVASSSHKINLSASACSNTHWRKCTGQTSVSCEQGQIKKGTSNAHMFSLGMSFANNKKTDNVMALHCAKDVDKQYALHVYFNMKHAASSGSDCQWSGYRHLCVSASG
eukprot:scaffold146445_cov17-Tisochrysis_lutea.AAC.2